jgi:NitT/TauT family transport system substrate-binding protein
MSRIRTVGLMLLIALILAACGGTPVTAPTEEAAIPVDLYLSYQPDVQFAPFYVAIERGIFEAHGLDVTITHQSESDAVRLVGTELGGDGLKAAVVSGEQVLLARAQDIPVKYVFAWYQRFPVAIASKTGQGIVTVNDLAGHSIGVPMMEGASYIGLRALLSAGGLSESDVTIEATGFTQVETLATDRVDAVVIYSTNEPIQLEAQGIDVNLINVSDVVDIVSNGLVVNENANFDQVEALVAAITEAVQYTIDHPSEAYEMSKKHVEGLNDPAVAETQQAVLNRSIELWKADRIGESNVAAWLTMQDTLMNMGLLTEPQEVEAAFTDEYLP